ncbi:hypothetical protein GGTG_07462 [Gaeumannomyces tritici R3-111a-1]|uniref:Fungal lipase-type domain-containing protein n=1 Tax=Gaeumannomyces tritici (strain R3-111a-1) TaxID=644352 RepID=J3P1R4_GAET3|nr:hypothetical protein GGTG_07462 [Gaeumannomyces tritici R3-111a-1]EJT73606.1 hypothetical protein GGTG_07462 [Gaeumannomyces tritici R3-111a-1]
MSSIQRQNRDPGLASQSGAPQYEKWWYLPGDISEESRDILQDVSGYTIGDDGGVLVSSEEFSSLYQFAKYAGAAYCAPNAKIGDPVFCKGEICPGRNATILATFAGRITDILGFLAEDPDSQTLTVSIRGSRTIQNFITDVIFRAQAADREFCAGCTVHAGFMYAHQEIVARVRAAVADALDEYPNHRVRVTGHSLGGAVATLLGATLRRRGVACDIYTYGAPRVGNEAFVRWVDAQDNGRLLRLTHYNDLVPQLPPIFLNYRHTSPELWLGSGPVNRNGYLPGDMVECPGSANVLCNAARSVLFLSLLLPRRGAYKSWPPPT